VTTLGGWLARNADLDRIDREVLLCAAVGISRARLLAAPEAPLPAEPRQCLDGWAARRRAGVPVAYLVGSQGFRDFELAVTADVLIPRPETELLVELALTRIEPGQRVLDLGTGSGAIAIALARDSGADVTGADVSPAALALAAANARALAARIDWLETHWFAAVAGRFHVIVSNPPYVAANDPHLDALRHEPALALVAGSDGLDALRQIVAAAPDHLEPGGWLLLEHGFDQGPAVRELLARSGFTAVATHQDLAGLDRVTLGRHHGNRQTDATDQPSERTQGGSGADRKT
jgi:release factor glutamine methyltransferase